MACAIAITACAVATSCCISDVPCQWQGQNVDLEVTWRQYRLAVCHSLDRRWPIRCQSRAKNRTYLSSTHTEPDTQTDRETDRQTVRERERERQTDRHTDRETDRQTDRHRDQETYVDHRLARWIPADSHMTRIWRHTSRCWHSDSVLDNRVHSNRPRTLQHYHSNQTAVTIATVSANRTCQLTFVDIFDIYSPMSEIISLAQSATNAQQLGY